MSMEISVNTIVKDTKNLMDDAFQALEDDLKTIRTGKASPALVENIQVNYYGSSTRLKDIANITAPEPRLLVIQPWDKNAVSGIEKAILSSNLGITPATEGNVIRLPIPELSEERRKELAKTVKDRGEETRIEVRNVRRKANDTAKKAQKSSEITEDDLKDIQEQIQNLTDSYIEQIDTRVNEKSDELLQL